MATPHLLMLSGIGPAEQLENHGIDVVAELPGVGQNLIDHPIVSTTATLNGPYSYSGQDKGWPMLKAGFQFKLFGSGPVTTSGLEAGAFFNPSEPAGLPTHESYCIPTILDPILAKKAGRKAGMTLSVLLLKPKSRGAVTLASSDPDQKPLVSPNFLENVEDVKSLARGLSYLLETYETHPLSGRIDEALLPEPYRRSIDDLSAYCLETVKSNYHPVGTAKMGADSDAMAVLDPQMRVRTVEGLRVCDLSSAPHIPSGNTCALAMVLGDRCAELMT